MNPDPIAKWLCDEWKKSNTGSQWQAAAQAIIDHPVEFAEELREAGFHEFEGAPFLSEGCVCIRFDPPEPPHVHEYLSWKTSVDWRCACGATATTYAPVPEP